MAPSPASRHRFDISVRGDPAPVVAIALIGSAIGAAIAGRLADRIGRLRVMQIAAALFTISARRFVDALRRLGPGSLAGASAVSRSASPP